MRLVFHLRAAKSLLRVAQPLTTPGWRRSVLVCMVAVAGLVGYCSAQDPSQPSSSYLRAHFGREDGLRGGVVDEIVQSHDGFLWLIVNGSFLTRFDGRQFTGFDSPAHATSLAVAPDGDLWVGTNDHLERIPAAA